MVDQGVAVITFPPRPHIITRLAAAEDVHLRLDSATPTKTNPSFNKTFIPPREQGDQRVGCKGGKDWPDLLFYDGIEQDQDVLRVIDTVILNN